MWDLVNGGVDWACVVILVLGYFCTLFAEERVTRRAFQEGMGKVGERQGEAELEMMRKTVDAMHSKGVETGRKFTPKAWRELMAELGDQEHRPKWSICFGCVIDLSAFADSHPGGAHILGHFVGRDMTPWMVVTHAKTQRALATLPALVVGLIDAPPDPLLSFSPALLAPVDQEYLRHVWEMANDGRLTYPLVWSIRDAFEVGIPLFVALLCIYRLGVLSLGIVFLGLGATRAVYWAHDVLHGEATRTEREGVRLVWWVSMVLWGFDFAHFAIDHKVHHGFTNLIGLDKAADVPFVPFHQIQVESGRNRGVGDTLRRMGVANVLFFVCLSPLLATSYIVDGMRYRYVVKKQSVWPWGVVEVLRLGSMFVFWEYQWPFLLAPILASIAMGLIATLNHPHQPMDLPQRFFSQEQAESTLHSFVALQVSGNTNPGQSDSNLVHALCGHFDLHIEHHLFPFLPRRRYGEIAQATRSWLLSHNLPYKAQPMVQAFASFNQAMRCPHNRLTTSKTASKPIQ